MIYKIYTEDRGNIDFLAGLVLRRFEGFNIAKVVGYYKGGKEASLCIEIDTLQDDNRMGVFQTTQDIKLHNNQECVLLQIGHEKSILV